MVFLEILLLIYFLFLWYLVKMLFDCFVLVIGINLKMDLVEVFLKFRLLILLNFLLNYDSNLF